MDWGSSSVSQHVQSPKQTFRSCRRRCNQEKMAADGTRSNAMWVCIHVLPPVSVLCAEVMVKLRCWHCVRCVDVTCDKLATANEQTVKKIGNIFQRSGIWQSMKIDNEALFRLTAIVIVLLHGHIFQFLSCLITGIRIDYTHFQWIVLITCEQYNHKSVVVPSRILYNFTRDAPDSNFLKSDRNRMWPDIH